MHNGGQYNDNNKNHNQNIHRTRVILPGEEGGQPRVLGPGDGYQDMETNMDRIMEVRVSDLTRD